MQELRLRLAALQREVERRQQAADNRPNLSACLFDKQVAVWNDTRKVKALRCGRRAGKSVFAAAWLLQGALDKAGTLNLYITLTRRNAKLIIWPSLKWLDARFNLGCTFNEAELTCTLPNGSTVMLGSCIHRVEIERYRGPTYFRVVVDECGSFPPYLEPLYKDILRPATIDHDGEILFAGTPPITWSGFWFDMVGPESSMTIPVYHWTMFDNPHLPHAARLAAEIREENGWSEDHPTYVREYKGICVEDLSDLVYPFVIEKNQAESLPDVHDSDGWRYVLGVDIGFTDAAAFVLTACHEELKNEYVLRSEKHTEWLTGQVAQRIRWYTEHFPGCVTVMDTGGMGKVHAEEARKRYGLAVEAAEKKEKRSAVRLTRDRLIASRVKLLAGECNDALRDEWATLRWDDKHELPADGQEDHASDACIYALRRLRHYSHKPVEAKPQPGTPEYYREEIRAMEQAHLRRYIQQSDRPEWDR